MGFGTVWYCFKSFEIRRGPAKVSAYLALTFILSGCSASIQGAPARSDTEPALTTFLTQSVSVAQMNAYRSASGQQKRELRNSIVLGRMALTDMNYTKYEQDLTRERQQAPFAATLASLALSGTGTIVSDAATKTALAVVDTALKGAKEAYDKDILAQQTIAFIQTQMRTNRNNVRSRIVNQLSLSADQYPLELAFLDLEDYYAAGTITGGLIGIGEGTAGRLTESEDIKLLSSTTYGADSATRAIRAYLGRGGQPARRALADWLRPRGVPAFSFLNAAEHAALRIEYARLIGAS